MAKSQSSSCLGWFLLFCILGIFIPGLWDLGRISNRSKEKRIFPTGEILTEESYLSSGLQGSDWNNQLYFQETESSPLEKLGTNIYGDWQSHTLPLSEAKLIRAKGLLLLIVLKEHIFQHPVLKGKSYWQEIAWMPNNVISYLGACRKADDQSNNSQKSRIDLKYHFDHLDTDQNLLITKRASPDSHLPLYLVYSSVTYNQPVAKAPGILDGFDWKFDLERTRATNNIKPPESPNLVVDVSVMTWTENMKGGWPSREVALSQPGAKELYSKSFPISSTDWKSVDYTTIDPYQGGQKTISKHVEFLFGFQDPVADSYTFCWRGKDLYGTQYPSVKIGEWKWASSGGIIEPELIFFRVRRPE